jgi:hypothetical protein
MDKWITCVWLLCFSVFPLCLCVGVTTVCRLSFDPSFHGDYISLKEDYRVCAIDSSAERWFTTRGRDNISSSGAPMPMGYVSSFYMLMNIS